MDPGQKEILSLKSKEIHICQFSWKVAMRSKCPSLLLYLFLLLLLMGDLAMALHHYALEEGYTKTIPRNHPLPITASWDLR